MAKKTVESTELAPIDDDMFDLMSPGTGPVDSEFDGAGLEDLDNNDVVLPRISLLQGMSKPVAEGMSGAKMGVWWLSPFNRPVTLKPDETAKFVVVRIFTAMRRWTPLDAGGGIECEAPDGKLIAREANGVEGATLSIEASPNGDVTSLVWEGGKPTVDCKRCVHGFAAASSAAGNPPPTKRGQNWIPKVVVLNGKTYKIPDNLRAGRCTQSMDALVLMQVPAYEDDDADISFSREIIPAFISFSRSSMPAGKSLASMLKMGSSGPAWSRIFQIGGKKTQNDKGIFYIATVKQIGFANEPLMNMAAELYQASGEINYAPDMTDVQHTEVSGAATTVMPSDDEAAPDDEF